VPIANKWWINVFGGTQRALLFTFIKKYALPPPLAVVTDRFIVQTARQCQQSVCGIDLKRGAGPARHDDVGQSRRRWRVTDDADRRLYTADDDAEGRVLEYVEHVERKRELDEVVTGRLVKWDVEDDAGTVLPVAGVDA